MSPTREEEKVLIKAEIEKLDRSLSRWRDTSMPAYGGTIKRKEELQSALDKLERVSDPRDHLRDAILKKKARIAEIERILNRPPLTEYRGQTIHGGDNWRLRLEEERQHLLIAVPELERELNQVGASGRSSDPQSSPPKSEEFKHSEDYRSVTVRGKNFTLTSRQAQVIQILDENRRNGLPDVGQDHLLEELGTRNSRLRDSFKTNLQAWKVLVKTGTKKGTVRLNV